MDIKADVKSPCRRRPVDVKSVLKDIAREADARDDSAW